ncbi:hypothetical protein, partial [Mycolicibacterium holsaticum]|uniref:hypothetical protein n=1 Tax=Mycolicibacterium holsaticum TaxID=152142 RepID=UPI001041C024
MDPEAARSDKIQLAVGCLSIVPLISADADETFLRQLMNKTWWKETLEAGLGLLPSVTDLRVKIDGIGGRMPPKSDILDTYVDKDKQEFDIDYDPGPSLNSSVEFNITIPKRMQASLLRGGDETECERFEVVTHYGYGGPVTFIRSFDQPGQSGRPSTFIVLVREFLIHELARANASVGVKPTPPSPFHAELLLWPSEEITTEFKHTWTKSDVSYDVVEFFYDPRLKSLDDAF